MKILIVKRDKLGDLLLTTPTLELLRQAMPEATIDVLANDYNHWVLAGNRDVNRIWIYRRARNGADGRRVSLSGVSAIWHQLRQFLQLRAEHYDWVLVANGEESRRAIQRALWLKGRRTVAYCNNPADYPGVSDALSTQQPQHESRQLAAMLVPLGIALPDALPAPHFQLSLEGDQAASSWLAAQSLAPARYITLGLGARRAKKQPTARQVLEWTRQVHERTGLSTVFMWTPGRSDNPLYPGDDEVAQPILDAGAPWIHPFRGPIQPALGLIWHGVTSLFPDSGLMHFAAASPGGVLGFFAETDVSPPPWRWGPVGPRAEFLEADKAVSELTDDVVLAAVWRRIAASPAAPYPAPAAVPAP